MAVQSNPVTVNVQAQSSSGGGSSNTTNTFIIYEKGLPANTTWYITIDGTQYSSPSNTPLTLTLSVGSHSYSVETIIDTYTYTPSPSSGMFNVSATQVNTLTITYSANLPSFTVSESGLPSGATYSVKLIGGNSYSATAPNNIKISLQAGVYAFSIPSVTYNGTTYTPSPQTANISFPDQTSLSISYSAGIQTGTYGLVCAGGVYRCVAGAGKMTLGDCESQPDFGKPCGIGGLIL